MGSIIAKITQDPADTRYVRWTSITDDVTHLFETEGEVIDYLLDDHPRNSWSHDREGYVRDFIRPMVERAKETGCSGRSNLSSQFRFDAADDDRINWTNRGSFHRSRLNEVCDILFYGDEADDDDDTSAADKLLAAGILIPFERD